MKWYQLGEMVHTCPKVNYKLNYKPGFIICPRTKKVIPYEKVEDKIKLISSLPIAEKKQLPYIQLDDEETRPMLKNEQIAKAFAPILKDLPFYYQETNWLSLGMLAEAAKEILIPFM